MSRITTGVGLITGFPINDTVDKLMGVAARPRDLLVSRTKKFTDEQTAITTLTALMVGVQLSGKRLSTASLYTQRSASSSDASALSVSVGTGGTPPVGSYQFTPVRRAAAQQLQSSRFASSTALVGAGTLTLGYGGQLDRAVNLDLLGGGTGFSRGKIRITDRSGTSAEIDLSTARTIDDVLAAVNDNATIDVTLKAVGDRLVLTDDTGDTAANLRVQEVGAGATAASLGLSGINVAASSATGSDVVKLFGSLTLSELNDGQGVRFNAGAADLQVALKDGTTLALDFHKPLTPAVSATATSPGTNSTHARLTFSAVAGGTDYNGVTISFVDNPGVTQGDETVVYDDSNPGDKKLIFQIDEGSTTAADLLAALNDDPAASLKFTAALAGGSNGTGLISTSDTVVTAGGTAEIAATNEQTLADVLATINGAAPTKLSAAISAGGDSLVLTDLTAGGGTFGVTALNDSQTLRDLGLDTTVSGATLTGRRILAGLKTTLLSSLAGGAGLGTLGNVQLTDRSGATATVGLAAAQTVDDVLTALNAAGLGLNVALNTARNGLLLTDTTGSTSSNLKVQNADVTNTADKLQLTLDAAQTTKNSGSLHRQTVNENTLLASLNGGTGVGTGQFTITDANGAVGTVSLTANQTTVGDVLQIINNLGLDLEARLSAAGDGIALVDTAAGSGTLSVTVGSGNAARDLRLLGGETTIDVGGTPTKAIVGAQTRTIELTATDTVEDLVDKLNAARLNATATLFNDGSPVSPVGFSLFVQRTGTAAALSIDASQATFNLTETVAAQDALLLYGAPGSPHAILATSATNTFTSVLAGATLEVRAASAAPVTITIGRTNSSLTTAVQTFADAHNRLLDKIAELTKFDETTQTGAVLFGNPTVLRAGSDLSRLLSGRIGGAGDLRTIAELGLTFDNAGKLQFDADRLQERFSSDPTAVEEFLSTAETGLGARLDKLTEQLAGVGDSLLVGRAAALSRIVETNNERIEQMNARLERQRERLLKQFQTMETTIGKLQSNLSALSAIVPLSQS